MKEVGKINSGDGFGEIALITPGNCLRSASIKCMSDCHFATIAKRDYLRIFKKIEERARDE